MAAPAPSAPVVATASISGTSGTALSFKVSVAASDAVTFALSNAPSGMSINASGVVSWAAPVRGTYDVTVSARDAVTGLSGQGLYTITINAAQPPVVASASLTGTSGAALNYSVSVTDSSTCLYLLPLSSWTKPTVGTGLVPS